MLFSFRNKCILNFIREINDASKILFYNVLINNCTFRKEIKHLLKLFSI